MDKTYTSESIVEIKASRAKVWDVITDADMVKQWFMGTQVVTTWQEGQPIVFKGEWQGKAYEDKGVILRIEEAKVLQYTHISSRTDAEDKPENYEVITFELTDNAASTTLTLKEDNIKSAESRDMSIKLWTGILGKLKELAER